jgi:hypothetical protein
VYVDTSVFGGVGDEEFADASGRFFALVQAARFVVLASQATAGELDPAPPEVRRIIDAMPASSLEWIGDSAEIRSLARAYIDAGVLGPGSADDAYHVAAATVARADLVPSWNFRHMVNYDRIRRFNAVNMLKGYGTVDIRTPAEVVYGD